MATSTTATPRNWTFIIVKSWAYGMFALGLGLSITHIYDLFRVTLGASVIMAAAMPFFVDGFQVIGRAARSHKMTHETRKIGAWTQGIGVVLSLIGNGIAGHTLGDRIGGVICVLGYVGMEALAEKIRPIEQDTATAAAALAAAQKQAASQRAAKAAATRKANATAKAQKDAERKERDRMNRQIKKSEIAAMEQAYAAASAPVSPAPINYDDAPYI
jgi:hypothetical protein